MILVIVTAKLKYATLVVTRSADPTHPHRRFARRPNPQIAAAAAE